MSSSEPPSTKSLDEGWGLSKDEPAPEDEPAPDSDDETRTMQVSAAFLRSFPVIEEGMSSDDRETLPPPLPVSEYVQTMMRQARDEPEPISMALSSPFGRQGSTAPASRRSANVDRATPPSRRAAGWIVPQAPRAAASAEVVDDRESFTLIEFEPELLDDGVADEVGALGDDPPLTPRSPGSVDLPEDEVTPVSVRTVNLPHFPSLHPGLLASLVPQHRTSTTPPHPPSSRGEPPLASLPPLLGAPWPSSPHARPTLDYDELGEPPATQRGLAAPPVPPRAQPGTARFGSIGDASVLPTPPSTRRAPNLGSQPPADPFNDVRELYDAGDFRSALVMTEALLEADPDHVDAKACAASCREMLSKKYLSRLGGLAKIPRVAMLPEEIRWLSLDHKAGFLLACIDGTSSIEEVLDVACMQEFEAIRILHDFRELGVIDILPDPRTSRR